MGVGILAYGPLEGEQHTVFRSELFAAAWVMENTRGRALIVSYSKGVVGTAERIIRGARVRTMMHHAALWRRAQRAGTSAR